jgi:hypothetical protein
MISGIGIPFIRRRSARSHYFCFPMDLFQPAGPLAKNHFSPAGIFSVREFHFSGINTPGTLSE